MFHRKWPVLLILAGLLAVASLLYAFSIPLPTPTFLSLPDTRWVKRLNGHVTVLSETIGERNWNHPAQLALARDYIARELGSYGYDVRLEEYDVQGKKCQNVVATREGADPRLKKEIVLAGGHYDSSPGTPGADDNASGVALLLELARALSARPAARTVRFVAFSTEEAYLFQNLPFESRLRTMGSYHHAAEAKKRGDDIVGMISLEMLGYYSDEEGSQKTPSYLRWCYPTRGNFALVVGDIASAGMVWKIRRELQSGTRLPVRSACLPRAVSGVENSDHRNFWTFGYPAAMLTDTAFYRNSHYHCATDTAEKLDYMKMSSLLPGLIQTLNTLAQE